jgi:hypothetical protein
MATASDDRSGLQVIKMTGYRGGSHIKGKAEALPAIRLPYIYSRDPFKDHIHGPLFLEGALREQDTLDQGRRFLAGQHRLFDTP